MEKTSSRDNLALTSMCILVFLERPETVLFFCFDLVLKDLETGPVKRIQETTTLLIEVLAKADHSLFQHHAGQLISLCFFRSQLTDR